MIVRRLELQNFRGFETMHIDLDPELTVLIGPNGSGKSALIRALAICLARWTGAFTNDGGDNRTGVALTLADARRARTRDQRKERAPETALHATVQLGSAEIEVVAKLGANTAPSGPLVERAIAARQALLRDGDDPIDLPLIAAYDARLGLRPAAFEATDDAERQRARTQAYQGVLSGGLALDDLEAWMKQQEMALNQRLSSRLGEAELDALTDELVAELQQGRSLSMGELLRERAGVRRAPLTRAVAAAVEACLEGAGELYYDLEADDLYVDWQDGERLPFDLLSDGQKRVTALAAGLAWLACRLNPHHDADAPRRARGVVLVDEIELHLHPAWQQTVIQRLRGAFPGVQFVVTTHSPQVLSTVHARHIQALRLDGGQGRALPLTEQTQGVSSADVLAIAMGVDPIPDVPAWRSLSRYRELIEDRAGHGDEARALRTELDAHFGARHPVMLECDQLIRLMSLSTGGGRGA